MTDETIQEEMQQRGERPPCSCSKCARLCSGKPGWFTAGQATKAAAELGLTLEEFFTKFCTRDYYISHGDRIFLLSPAWVGNGPAPAEVVELRGLPVVRPSAASRTRARR